VRPTASRTSAIQLSLVLSRPVDPSSWGTTRGSRPTPALDGDHGGAQSTSRSPSDLPPESTWHGIHSEWRALGWPCSRERLSGRPPRTATCAGTVPERGRLRRQRDLAWTSQGIRSTPRTTTAASRCSDNLRGPCSSPTVLRSNRSRHGAAVVATAEDGAVYAFRANARDSVLPSPRRWPAPGRRRHATTAPALSPRAKCWWADDGRVFAIAGSDSAAFPPFVSAISERSGWALGESPSLSSGTWRLGRFRGPGSYLWRTPSRMESSG